MRLSRLLKRYLMPVDLVMCALSAGSQHAGYINWFALDAKALVQL